MRKILLVVLTVGLTAAMARPVLAQEELKAVIVKAVKAHGGEEKLGQLQGKGFEVKGKGTIHLLGGFAYTSESSAQLPDKFKEVTQMEIMGQQVTQIVVVNGDKSWIKVNGMDVDLGEMFQKEVKEQMYERRVQGLLPLLKEKHFELAPLGEVKVEGKDTIGVKVSSKDRRDVALYFAKDSGLLVKSESRVYDLTTMQEVTQEMFFSEYKEENGYTSPRKLVIHRDGKKFMDKEVTEIKYLDKIADDVFAKP